MKRVECKTQAEADAAAAAGDAIVWRAGHLILHGSSVATLYGSGSGGGAVDGLTGSTLRRDRPRLILGPLGSRNDTLGVSLPSYGSEPIVYAGCWSGWLSEFAARVDEVYPTGRYGDEYRAAIAMIRAVAAIPQEAT